jgi:hypothetical protein
MAIKISAMIPVKKVLSASDPSEDSWVMIKPITYRADLQRGELLKEREVANDAYGGSMTKGINMYRLRAEELWLTYADAHIVFEDEDGGETEPFSSRDDMTKADFMQALADLAPAVVLEWHRRMVEVNPDWAFPF